jgi:thioredoxin reductase (NADPH)
VDEDFQPNLERSTWREVPADFVLLLIGYQMDSSLLESAGVELRGSGRAPFVNPETMETNVPGFYVAGTAAAGTQLRFKLFIENCHTHVVRILRHLTDQDPKHINPLAFSQQLQDPLVAES